MAKGRASRGGGRNSRLRARGRGRISTPNDRSPSTGQQQQQQQHSGISGASGTSPASNTSDTGSSLSSSNNNNSNVNNRQPESRSSSSASNNRAALRGRRVFALRSRRGARGRLGVRRGTRRGGRGINIVTERAQVSPSSSGSFSSILHSMNAVRREAGTPGSAGSAQGRAQGRGSYNPGGSGSGGGGGGGFGSSPGSSQAQNDICPICRTPITNLCITNCNHRFCLDCIRRWTTNNVTCPTCRATIHTIRNILPNGGTEIIQISRAELVAHKVNEIHSILMILFTVMSHTLLPEVVNYMDQLNEIARELDVPTTSTRMRDAQNAASESASSSRATSPLSSPAASGSTGASPANTPRGGRGSLQTRNLESPQSALLRRLEFEASPDSSRSSSPAATLSPLTVSTTQAGPSSTTTATTTTTTTTSTTTPRTSTFGSPAGGPTTVRESSTHHPASSSSSATPSNSARPTPSLLSSTSRPSVAPATPTTPTSATPSSSRTLHHALLDVPSTLTRSRATGTPESPASSGAGSTSNQPATSAQPAFRAGTHSQMHYTRSSFPHFRRPSIAQEHLTPAEEERRREQRLKDIRFLSESYNKINQVYEVLMIMHMVIHRNQVEVGQQ